MIDNQLRNYIRKYHSVLFPGVIGQLERRRKSNVSSSAAKIFFGPSNLKSSHSKCKTSIFLSSAFSLSPSSCAVLIIIKCLFIKSHFHAVALSLCYIYYFLILFKIVPNCKTRLLSYFVFFSSSVLLLLR